MLYLIGLGLDNGEITKKGLDALGEVDKAYAEFYTNTANIDIERLESQTGTSIEVLERTEVEQEDQVIESSKENDTAFLVSGDPLTATTHFDIKHRAEREGIEVKVIHAPSIFTSIAETGLSIYKFGRTVTLPRDSEPESITRYIEKNDSIGLHSLVLLDIDYPANLAAEKLLKLGIDDRETIVLERANRDSMEITRTTLEGAAATEFGDTPHSIILVGETSHVEDEFLESL